MFSVYGWTYSKNKDSTITPSSASGTEYQCNLKSPCSIVAPSLEFRYETDFAPSRINYFYIPVFRRYYFVTEWTFDRGVWTADLQVDVLGSWESEIKTQTEYVLRASKEFDGMIIDTLYPITSEYSLNAKYISHDIATTIEAGYYVVGIINSSASAIGAVSYYVFTQDEFADFKNKLMTSSSWTGVLDISEDLLKTIFNPFQYVVSCKWFPVVPSMGDPVSSFPFGWWTFEVSCHLLSPTQQSAIRTREFYAGLPQHPQSDERGGYLNLPPYTERYLGIAPYGLINLPAWSCMDGGTITLEEHIDYITGISTLIVKSSNSPEQECVVCQISAAFALDIQLAQVSTDYMPFIRSGIDAASKALSLDFGGAISEAASGIASLVTAAPLVQTGGGNDGLSALIMFNNKIWVYSKFNRVADDSITRLGRPLCSEKILRDLAPGYVKCLNAQVAMAATDSEIEEIQDALNNGIYIAE